jgi:hypothetical protein
VRVPDDERSASLSVRPVMAERWWAPFDAVTPHALYSLTKSFTSTGIGFAVAEDKLSGMIRWSRSSPKNYPKNRVNICARSCARSADDACWPSSSRLIVLTNKCIGAAP